MQLLHPKPRLEPVEPFWNVDNIRRFQEKRLGLPAIKNLIGQNRLSILGLFPFIKVCYVNTGDIERFDPRHLSFFNVNTEADLRTGREIAGQEDDT